MLLVYENKQQMVSAEWKTPVHMPPHLHEAIGSDDLIYSSVAYVVKNYRVCSGLNCEKAHK